jgi:predicted transcriptional regulator
LPTAFAVKKLENGEALSTREIAVELSISQQTVLRNLKAAVKCGLLIRVGVLRSPKWRVSNTTGFAAPMHCTNDV